MAYSNTSKYQNLWFYIYGTELFAFTKKQDVSKITELDQMYDLKPTQVLWMSFHERDEEEGGNYVWCRKKKQELYCNVLRWIATSKQEDKGIALEDLQKSKYNTFETLVAPNWEETSDGSLE